MDRITQHIDVIVSHKMGILI